MSSEQVGLGPSRKSCLLPLFLVLMFLTLLATDVSLAQEIEDDDDLTSDPQDLQHPHADSCVWTGGSCEWDYHMRAMTAEFENGHTANFFAYVDPDVSTYYNEPEGSRKVVEPQFQGMFAKFINISPKSIRVSWVSNDSNNKQEPPMYICDIEPFGSAGTASFPGHTFQIALTDKPDKVLTTFTTIKGQSLYPFEPYKGDYEKAYRKLPKEQFQRYMMQHNNLLFSEQYKEKAGREWLALYGQRFPPRYHMWPAEFFGQTHTITTKEIYFVEYPPEEELAKGVSLYGPRPDETSRNRKYRDTYPSMNLTLKVLSCAPRVFEIQNFLGDLEVEHILQVAQEKELTTSTTKAGAKSQATEQESSRTSTNTWVPRHQSIILDAIYRRAADVMQIDEKFFRYRRPLEIPEFDESKVSISENLQLVHYNVGQQYVS